MDLFGKLKDLKILLIDDDEWIRDSLSLLFEGEGCHLQALESAEEGMEALTKQAYDVVISDYSLPGMDGLEFFKRVKQSNPHVLKVLITVYGSKEVFLKARKIGIQEFIDKPFTSQTIEESLTRVIKSRGQY
jgi:DNA-binding NtrC family response regulator